MSLETYAAEIDEKLKTVKDLNPGHSAKQTQMVRTIVGAFLAVFKYNDRKAMDNFFSPKYVQHNPYLGDGPDSPLEFAYWKRDVAKRENNYDGPPDLIYKRFVVDGDLLSVHLHWVSYPGDLGINIVDVFKFDEDLKLLEHWDCNQPVLDPKEHKNSNGIF